MHRAALLIGVSRYSSGLPSLPGVQGAIGQMRSLLKQPRFGFDPVDCPSEELLQTTQAIQERIEIFFRSRHLDDHVLFLLAGNVIQDEDGKLYFATPETLSDEHGQWLKARAIAASFIQDVMNASRARHQVLVLDCHLYKGFGSEIFDNDPINLEEQLGGNRRVILTGSFPTHAAAKLSDLSTWSYTRYLTDGIETGAADSDSNGKISAEDLHNYVAQKLKIAAPTMKPQIYGSEESRSLPLLVNLPVNDAQVRYRKVLEQMVDQALADINGMVSTDATATKILENRAGLDDIAYSLGLLPQEAAEIEKVCLQPWRDRLQRLQTYRELFESTTLGDVEANYQNREDLRQHRQALNLREEDTAAIEAEQAVKEEQQQRQQHQVNLNRYEQVLLLVMQRRYSLGQSGHVGDDDRRLLNYLQQTFGLQDEEVQAIETDMATRLNRRTADTLIPESHPSETQPPVGEVGSPAENSLPQNSSPQNSPPNSSPSNSPQPDLQRQANTPLGQPNFAQQRQPNPTQAQTVTTVQPPGLMTPDPASYNPSQQIGLANGGQPAIASPEKMANPASGQPVENFQSPPAYPGQVAGNPNPEPPVGASVPREVATKEQDVRKSKASITKFLWPLIGLLALLAAFGGIWLATRSVNQPGNPFGTKPPPPPDVSTPTLTPIKQAAENINLGVTAHDNRNLDSAIRYFNDAIGTLSNDCKPQAGDNLQTANCQLLARAYSNRSYAYFDQQNYAQAVNDANQAVSLAPNLADARVNLANAKFKRGDQNGALQDYEQALQLNPNNLLKAGIYNNRGNVYFAQKNYETALSDYDRALNLRKNYADAFYNRGLANEALGNIQSAISDFQKAAKFYQDQNNFDLEKSANNRITALKQGSSKGNPAPSPNSTNL